MNRNLCMRFHRTACLAVLFCLLLPVAVLGEEANSIAEPAVGQSIASPSSDGAAGEKKRGQISIVILADDPNYEKFLQESAAEKLPERPVSLMLDTTQRVERVIVFPPPLEAGNKANKSQLFIFQNVTQASPPAEAPAVSLMDFRREQIETVRKTAAGKNAP